MWSAVRHVGGQRGSSTGEFRDDDPTETEPERVRDRAAHDMKDVTDAAKFLSLAACEPKTHEARRFRIVVDPGQVEVDRSGGRLFEDSRRPAAEFVRVN